MKRNTLIESFINAQDAPAVVIDKNYKIVAANRAYCESYGVDTGAVTGHSCFEISHHSPVPCHQNGEECPHQKALTNTCPVEVLHTHYDYANRPDRVRIKAYAIETADGDRFVLEVIHRLAPAVQLTCDDMRIVGRSRTILQTIETLGLAAGSDVPVLLYGETGTGKEMAARYVHEHSARSTGPYVEISCAAIPETLFESELFGHERGAFTGCAGLKRGLFETAHHGTLFLDEIGELPPSMQAKLLRVLDSGAFRRLGGTTLINADVRIVTATNRNLMAMVAEGSFREDLYFRIAGVKIPIPPLRERQTDVPALAEVLLKRLCDRDKAPYAYLSKEAMERLMHYSFPGNVRELLHILQTAMALSRNGIITADHIRLDGEARCSAGPAYLAVPPELAPRVPAPGAVPPEPSPSLADVEARHITDLLHRFGSDRRAVARALGISERTLYRKLKRYQLNAPTVALE